MSDADKRAVYVFDYDFELHARRRVGGEIPVNDIPRCEGFFLGWGVDWEEVGDNAGNYTVAIVEMKDGTVELICPKLIRFMGPGKKNPAGEAGI